MAFSVPDLPYAYDALEPHISEETMRFHHDKHHQAYVDKANAALDGTPFEEARAEDLLLSLDELPDDLRDRVRDNVGGHVNHSLFWTSMKPDGGGQPGGKLLGAIKGAFGNFKVFKDTMRGAAASVFGSGWAWLVDDGTRVFIVTTTNQDSPVSDGLTPLVGIDLWEHAYYLQYENRRPEYVDAWLEVIDWAVVEARYDAMPRQDVSDILARTVSIAGVETRLRRDRQGARADAGRRAQGAPGLGPDGEGRLDRPRLEGARQHARQARRGRPSPSSTRRRSSRRRPTSGSSRRAAGWSDGYATGRRWRSGRPSRSSRTTASTSPSPSRRRPSVTAATIPRLRWMSAAIVSSIVSAASRYQAVTASRWPMRWQRSSAWSCIAGVHSSSRNATFDARVSVMPCAATRVAPMSSCGPPARLERRDGRLARGDRVAPSRCAASGKRASTASWTSMWRAKTTSGSPDSRKSSDPGQRGGELAAGGEPLQRPELREALGAQRRGDPRLELAQVQRLLAQPGDDVLLGEPVLALVGERDRHDDLALGRQLGEDLGLQAAHEAAPAQVPVQALLRQLAAELPRELRARAEVLQAPDDAQLADELLGVVEHRRAAEREPQPVGRDGRRQAPHRLRALGLRVLDVVRLVDDERLRRHPRERLAVGGDDLVVEDRDVGVGADRCRGPR